MWRYGWNWKTSTEDYTRTLSIKFLKKYWYLDKWIGNKTWWLYWKLNWEDNWNIWIEITKWESSWIIRVYFTQTDREWIKKELDYEIELVSTSCNYWWVRWWFLCPCKWNRCSILYKQNNWIFASRKTLDLCYDDQKRSHQRRIFNIAFPNESKAMWIYETIKYKYRNWKATRKYKRYLKIINDDIPLDVLHKMQLDLLMKK